MIKSLQLNPVMIQTQRKIKITIAIQIFLYDSAFYKSKFSQCSFNPF